jgi:ketosteroid isomerase-like protein
MNEPVTEVNRHGFRGQARTAGHTVNQGDRDVTQDAHAQETRRIVGEFLARLGTADIDGVANLFAPTFEWRLNWPATELDGPIPWIRPRHTRGDVMEHFHVLAAHNAANGQGTTIDRILVDGLDAVLLGTIRNVMRPTGAAYEADFALHLTVVGGQITRYHIYEDSLAVERAWHAGDDSAEASVPPYAGSRARP